MSEDTKDQAPQASELTATESQATEAASTEAASTEAEAAQPEAEPTTGSEPPTRVQPSDEEDDAVLDSAGRERPRFLLGFPPHPELSRLSAAFEAGNYALVRAEAEGLAQRAESPAVRAAALELRRRIEPDPLAKYLLALTGALLLSLAYWAYHH